MRESVFEQEAEIWWEECWSMNCQHDENPKVYISMQKPGNLHLNCNIISVMSFVVSLAQFQRLPIFWQAIEQLVKRDYTTYTDTEAVYAHYDTDIHVNQIQLKMRADHKHTNESFFHPPR